ncbi:hypothetical protein A5884_000703, partial [Enterococcus sp. 7D2_DIV0200]
NVESISFSSIFNIINYRFNLSCK